MFRERFDCLKQIVEELILKESEKSPSTHDEWKKYCFTLIDVRKYGSSDESGVLNNSEIAKQFEPGVINLLSAENLVGCSSDSPPYHMVEDKIFWLKTFLMWPQLGKLTKEQLLLCYRQSRATTVDENTFGAEFSQ